MLIMSACEFSVAVESLMLEPKLVVSFIHSRPLSPDYDPLCCAVSAAGDSLTLIIAAQILVVQQ
jgi:hypothetical protein